MKKLKFFLTLLLLAVSVNVSWAQLPTSGKVYNIRFVSNQSPQKSIYLYLDGGSLNWSEREAPATTETKYQWYITHAVGDRYEVQNVSNSAYYLKQNSQSVTNSSTGPGTDGIGATFYLADWMTLSKWNQGNSSQIQNPQSSMIDGSLYIPRSDLGTGVGVLYQDAAGSTTWAFDKMGFCGYDCGWNTIDRVLTSQVLMDEVEYDYYSVTYQDEHGVAIAGARAIVSAGYADWIDASGANNVKVGSTVTGFVGKDFRAYSFVSATIDGNTYDNIAEMITNAAKGSNVVVTLAEQPYMDADKYYVVRHKTNTNAGYVYDLTTGAEDGNNLSLATIAATQLEPKYVFKFEDAGDGMFFVKNMATGRYVRRPGAVSRGYNLKTKTEATPTAADYGYWITNAVSAGHPELYALGDATILPNPVSQPFHYSWHNNSNTQIVRWGAGGDNSQWYLDEMPVVTLTFINNDTKETIENPTKTVMNSSSLLPDNQVFACFKGIYFDDYAVVSYELDGQSYSTRTQFFEACHNLKKNANATLKLRTKVAGEKDLTIQLWKTKGNGYTQEDCLDEAWVWSDHDTNAADKVSKKVWKLNVTAGDVDIKGETIPTDLEFKIVSNLAEGVGGTISNDANAAYRYGQVAGAANCICFESAMGDGNTFDFSVSSTAAEEYYILQYNLGLVAGVDAQTVTVTNEGGAHTTVGGPGSGQTRYRITDTPAAATCSFKAVANADVSKSMAANYFRVRIVNKAYLQNSMERGLALVEDALYDSSVGNAVGYPDHETTEYTELKQALDDVSAAEGGTEDEFNKYLDMLQKYSKYLSCTNLNMPEDCKVYTISFIKNDGTRVLLNNNDGTLGIVDYTADNLAEHSARWISHINGNGKLVGIDGGNGKLMFVNKADGKYLQANASGLSVSETYDADVNSFTAGAITQDLSDYMASATDEKLLGAIYLENSEATNLLTMQNADNSLAVQTAAQFNTTETSAIVMEFVDTPDTYNNVTFRKAKATDDQAWASYYGFYPVGNPAGITMYYVTGEKDGYLKLQEVQANVIKPNFGVILMREKEGDTHLHLGEYTTTVRDEIAANLSTNGANLLKGTIADDEERPAATNTYVLSGNDEDGIGFFKYTATYLPKGKAYYTNTETLIRGFMFDIDGVTTTVELNPAAQKDAKIYDLSGRRLNDAKSGLYIINGKKVVM